MDDYKLRVFWNWYTQSQPKCSPMVWVMASKRENIPFKFWKGLNISCLIIYQKELVCFIPFLGSDWVQKNEEVIIG